ncbi:uncharacterized protein LOC128390837 [Panonychus citri]|uniref:uncharacterized protein LOC128390837 n=1 Tax=Panonychus citri TaxID=50023 RepID=UPI002307D98F|nr:uncharacterized protein LOC128390837 [Panonychus citri]
MDVFPQNTLTKFSNRLARPIDLSGEWLVGLQEIFYPSDISATARSLSVHLLIDGFGQKVKLDVMLEANDDKRAIIDKINIAMRKHYNTTKSKRPKRDIMESINNLLKTESSNFTTEEKLSHLKEIKSKGLAAFEELLKKIDEMSGKVTEKEKEIASLSTEVSERNKQVEVINANLAARIVIEDDFDKYKKTAQKMLADQTEKITKLEKQPNKDAEIFHLKEELKDALARTKGWETDAIAKRVEASKLRAELEILKSQRDANLLSLQGQYDNMKEETDIKIKKIEKDLNESKATKSEKTVEFELQLERCKQEQEAELRKLNEQMENESKTYADKANLMEEREKVYQQYLKESREKVENLQKSEIELREKIATLVPKHELNNLNQKVEAISTEKTAVEVTLKELKEKHDSLAIEVVRLNEDLNKQRTEKNQLLDDIERVRRQLYKFKPLVENELTISEDDKVPLIELVGGKITVHRGYLDNRIIVPHFNDSAFLSALGFDAYGYLDKIGRLLTTNEVSMTAEKPAALDFQPHLMFVNSDIVSEHFVGDKSARVLRVLPLRGDEKKQIIHERFIKPHYYPLRSNRMEDINFILSDETGEQVKFNSGRVCIGLHLKKVV